MSAVTVPGFEIQRSLGRGAHGEVFLAREAEGLRRLVALKVFGADVPEAYARELEMTRRIEAIRSQGRVLELVQSLGVGEHEGRGWLALEYVEEGCLTDLIEARGPLPASEAWSYARDAAVALEHLLDAGLFHRDVKPGNLLLGSDGKVRLGDFGLSRDLDGSLSAVGSAAFAAPEVIAGQPGDGPRVDVYSLGATFAFLLTGETMRPGHPSLFAFERHDVPRPLQELIFNAMAFEPSERPQDARAFRAALEAIDASALAPAANAARPRTVAWGGAPPTPAPHEPQRAPAEKPPPATTTHRRALETLGLILGLGLVAALVAVLSSPEKRATAPAKATGKATLASTLASAPAGAVIKIAPGVYTETLRVHSSVRLEAEPGSVVLRSPPDGPCLLIASGAPIFSGLTLRGEGAAPAVVVDGGKPRFEGCAFKSNRGTALVVTGPATRLQARDCRFQSLAADGVRVEEGADAELDGCTFETHETGLAAQENAVVRLTGCTFSECNPGVFAARGAEATLERTRVLRSQGQGREHAGLHVRSARCRLVDVEVSGGAGAGLLLQSQARIEAEGLEVRANTATGIWLSGAAQLTARDVTVVGHHTYGIVTKNEECRVDLEDATLSRNNHAIWTERGSRVSVTRGRMDGNNKPLYMDGTSGAKLTSVTITNSRESVSSYHSELELIDCVLEGGSRVGVRAGNGALLRLVRTRIRSYADDGVWAIRKPGRRPSRFEFQDTFIEGNGGVGLRVSPAATGELRGCRILDNRGGDMPTRPEGLKLIDTVIGKPAD